MAILQDLIKQVTDPELRQRILQEVDKLAKQKKFGLVFEEHLPECTPLYDVPIKEERKVALKDGKVDDIYLVRNIKGNTAICEHRVNHEYKKIALDDLVAIAEFGESIYPYLRPIDSVCNAPNSDLWHTLIEADNYHAMQLLDYLYHGKVDCIYIDPPYNTGAEDWKYNNNYVDKNDQYRHSKWLSFMKRRLKLAKNLLNPEDSVLIITIDEKEYNHLGCLLEEIFPEAQQQMVSITIAPSGTKRENLFSRSDEYAYILLFGAAHVEHPAGNGNEKEIRWFYLRRTDYSSRRGTKKGGVAQFYPIYVDNKTKKIVHIGNYLTPNQNRNNVPVIEGATPVFPVRDDGVEMNWGVTKETLQDLIDKGFVQVSEGTTQQPYIFKYVSTKYKKKFKDGRWKIIGERDDGSKIIVETQGKITRTTTVWQKKVYDAGAYGTTILKSIIGDGKFSFPKSLYAVCDTLNYFVAKKEKALIVDFFAGSGTTLHAVNLLNAGDGGHRRCIMVTNNEVSNTEANSLKDSGFKPGDQEWEKLGIARHVTWPRTKCSINGMNIGGEKLNGEYFTNLNQEKKSKRRIEQLNFEIPKGTNEKKIKKQIISLLGKNKLAQSLVKDECSYIISEDYPTAILFDDEKLNDFLDNLENQSQVRELYICTQDNKVLKKAKEAIEEILGDFIETVPVTIPMADGFKANAAFFKLGFLDKNAVALGRQFKELLPVLWMKAGCIGPCPQLNTEELPHLLMLPKNHFAVLLDETYYLEFDKKLMNYPEIKTVYIITDSESAYRNMIQDYEDKECYQLYRDYLDNFRINTRR